MHLPAMMECYNSPKDILNYAYKVLVQMIRQHLTDPDEVKQREKKNIHRVNRFLLFQRFAFVF